MDENVSVSEKIVRIPRKTQEKENFDLICQPRGKLTVIGIIKTKILGKNLYNLKRKRFFQIWYKNTYLQGDNKSKIFNIKKSICAHQKHPLRK